MARVLTVIRDQLSGLTRRLEGTILAAGWLLAGWQKVPLGQRKGRMEISRMIGRSWMEDSSLGEDWMKRGCWF